MDNTMPMVKRLFLALLLLPSLGCLAASQAWACQARFIGKLRFDLGNYDAFYPIDKLGTVKFDVQNVGGQDCSFAFVLSRLRKQQRLGGQLSYEIVSSRGREIIPVNSLGAAASAKPDQLDKFELAAAESKQLSFSVKIPRGQFSPVGRFSDVLLAHIFALDDSGRILEAASDEKELDIMTLVEPRLSINLAGGARYGHLHFGDLEENASKAIQFETRSNQKYKMAVRSSNGGRLKLQSREKRKNDFVSYDAFLNGSRLALGKHQFDTNIQAIPDYGVGRHALEIKIGPTRYKRAGLYKDVIEIEIISVIP